MQSESISESESEMRHIDIHTQKDYMFAEGEDKG